MSNPEPLAYTETEVKSVLPSGWSLPEDSPGSWEAAKGRWTARVLDDVEFDWPVVVQADAAARLGRFEALRQAMDQVYRERLG